MEISITVKGESLSDLATKVAALGATLNGLGMNEAEEQAAAEEKPKRTRKTKAKEEPEETVEETVEETEEVEDTVEDLDDSEDEAEETSDDMGDMDDMDEDEETEDDEEPAKIDTKQLAQLKKALNSYSAKNGKPKAVKILHKFAKVSQDVKAEDFAKIMEDLKV